MDVKKTLRNKLDPYQMIDEGGLSRILTKHYQDGFIIITSYRNDNDEQINKETFKALKGDLKVAGYGFIPVFGGYIENKGSAEEREVYEPALIVPNHKVGTHDKFAESSEQLKNLGVALCDKYKQEAVLYKPTGDNTQAFYLNANGVAVDEFNDLSINDLTKQYFTKLSTGRGQNDRRFTFLYLSKSPSGINEAVGRYGEQFYNLNR